jgi:hypothetical protein
MGKISTISGLAGIVISSYLMNGCEGYKERITPQVADFKLTDGTRLIYHAPTKDFSGQYLEVYTPARTQSFIFQDADNDTTLTSNTEDAYIEYSSLGPIERKLYSIGTVMEDDETFNSNGTVIERKKVEAGRRILEDANRRFKEYMGYVLEKLNSL